MKYLFLFLSALIFTNSLYAQVAGTTKTVTKDLIFQESLTDVELDPTPLVGEASKVAFIENFSSGSNSYSLGASLAERILGEAGISIPGWLYNLANGIGSFFCSSIDPTFNASASVEAGGYYRTNSVGNADIDINYPVQVTVTYPDQNTFGCGDVVTIQTSYTILPAATDKLKVKPPFINQEIGPVVQNLNFNAAIGLDAMVGFGVTVSVPYPCPTLSDPFKICYYQETVCGNKQYFNQSKDFNLGVTTPSLPPLLNICEDAFGPGANEASLLSCIAPGDSSILSLAQEALDDFNAPLGTNYSFTDFPDTNTVEISPPDLPSPCSACPTIPEMEGTFKRVTREELTFKEEGGKLLVSGDKSSLFGMYVDLVSLLEFSGITTSLSLGGGQGSMDIGDIAPAFTVDQDLSFEFTPVVHLRLDLGRPMDYMVHNPDGSMTHSGTGQWVNLLAGQYIQAIYPEDLSQPTELNGHSFIDGNFKTLSSQEYYRSLEIRLGEIDIPGVVETALVNTTLAKSKFGENTILDHSFNLATNNSVSLPAFVLDPENPVVALSYLDVEDVLNLGGGERAVVYKVGVRNEGDVPLHDVEVYFDLGLTFQTASSYSIECLYSADLIVNGFYDGSADANLLAAGNTLETGQTSYIEVLVKVKPEVAGIDGNGCFETVEYNASANAFGTSPIGTKVESNFNHCTQTITMEDLVANIDLGAAAMTELNDFTVYGWEELRFDKPALLSKGNAGSASDVIFENVSLNEEPGEFTLVGDIHCGDTLFLLGESKVSADYFQVAEAVHIPNWKSGINPTGAISAYSDCVTVIPEMEAVIPENSSNEKVFLNDDESRTLAPGNYREVRLRENSTLLMSSGIYNIEKWAFLGDNSTVKYDLTEGPIVINLNTWQPLNNPGLRFIIEGEGSTRDIFYNYAGVQQCKFHSSFVQGNIFAPEAEVQFANGSFLEGTCHARKVNFKWDSGFTGHKFLEELNINAACQNLLALPQPSSSQFSSNPGQGAIETRVYPNPFTDLIYVDFQITQESQVELVVYDLNGRVVHRIGPKTYGPGTYQIEVKAGSNFAAGVYQVRIRLDQDVVTRRIVKLGR